MRIPDSLPSNEITTIKNIFNNYNHKIRFTVEEESYNRICFFDVLVIRDGKYIKTNWYQKPTWFCRFLHYHSHHPFNYKIYVVNNLVDRGITLAHKSFHKENIQKIKSTLLKNSYPLAFLNFFIKKRLILLSQRVSKTNTHIHEVSERAPNTHIRTTHSNLTGQTPEYVPLPYVQGVSERLLGILKPFNIKIAPRNTNGLSKLFKSIKDPMSNLDTANVVYNIPCFDCTAAHIPRVLVEVLKFAGFSIKKTLNSQGNLKKLLFKVLTIGFYKFCPSFRQIMDTIPKKIFLF